MRVLIVSYAQNTHYFNLVPLAWALRTAGHEVRVASQPRLAETIVESGLFAVPLGTDHRFQQVLEEGMARNDPNWTERSGLLLSDSSDIGPDDYRDLLAEYTRDYLSTVNNDELIDDLVAYAREWRPDLIVWEHLSWAGAIAAMASGTPHARLMWGYDMISHIRRKLLRLQAELPSEELHAAEERLDPVAGWLTDNLARHGCSFDEDVVTGQWTIEAGLASYRLETGLRTVGMRYVPYNGPAALPDWLRGQPTRPRVCVTAGVSVRGYFGFDMIPISALHAFADLDIEVIATLVPGPGESLDDAPANATLLEFVPMQGLLPTCSAVIHIGGVGIQSTAIHYGVPQLILPGLADTVLRAKQVVDAGAGLVVLPDEVTPERVRADLSRLLNEPEFSLAAERLRQEAAAVPSPNDVVPVLERLTAEHMPSPSQSGDPTPRRPLPEPVAGG